MGDEPHYSRTIIGRLFFRTTASNNGVGSMTATASIRGLWITHAAKSRMKALRQSNPQTPLGHRSASGRRLTGNTLINGSLKTRSGKKIHNPVATSGAACGPVVSQSEV